MTDLENYLKEQIGILLKENLDLKNKLFDTEQLLKTCQLEYKLLEVTKKWPHTNVKKLFSQSIVIMKN